MNCIQIIKEYLIKEGFDGLQNQAECGCQLSDLIPCQEDFSTCTPGYKVTPPSEIDCEFDFYIVQDKKDTPWT